MRLPSKTVTLQLWDTAGTEQFSSFVTFSSAYIVIQVSDSNDRENGGSVDRPRHDTVFIPRVTHSDAHEFVPSNVHERTPHRFRAIPAQYYRGGRAVVFVFDVTVKESFTHICSRWMPEWYSIARSAGACRFPR